MNTITGYKKHSIDLDKRQSSKDRDKFLGARYICFSEIEANIDKLYKQLQTYLHFKTCKKCENFSAR